MPDTFTTEQVLKYPVKIVDGRGRPQAAHGDPVAETSDPTIMTVAVEAGAGVGEYTLTCSSVTPGEARATLKGDADLGDGVNEFVGFKDVTVTLDPRSGARIFEFGEGAAEDV